MILPFGTKKELGQHFLQDQEVIGRIVQEAIGCGLGPCTEIGPGAGALTGPLLRAGFPVLAVEKDPRAVAYLRSQYPALEVILCDVLKWRPEAWGLCIGNLPYGITSDILLWFLEGSFSHGIFMMQREVAERLGAKPGTKAYGRLTVRVSLQANVTPVVDAPPGAFLPPPKVHSRVVHLWPRASPFGGKEEEKAFSAWTAFLFSSRRKMLRSVLSAYPWLWDQAASVGPSFVPTARCEDLSPQEIFALFHLSRAPPGGQNSKEATVRSP